MSNSEFRTIVFNKAVFQKLKSIAEKLNISANKAVNQSVEMYVKKNKKELK